MGLSNPKARGIVWIIIGCTRKRFDSVLIRNGSGLVCPVHQIGARSVPPAYIAPYIGRRIVLKEQVPGGSDFNQAVWLVHPVLVRCEVV